MKIKQIVREVENGKQKTFKRYFNATYLYTIHKGKALMYDEDETMPGVTVQFQNHYEPSTTSVYCPNVKRAYEIIEYQETNRGAIHIFQKALGDYIVENKMY